MGRVVSGVGCISAIFRATKGGKYLKMTYYMLYISLTLIEVSWLHSCGRKTEKHDYLTLVQYEHQIANAGILM